MPRAYRASTRRSSAGTTDPIAMLKDDHQRVAALFKRFEEIGDDNDGPEKEMIVRRACAELRIHAAVEEELFYPAAREVIADDDIELLDEAHVEHASVKDLVAQLEAMDLDAPLFDAKFSVLGEYVRHHVKEEESQIFPRLKKARLLNADALGQEMSARKKELQTALGVVEDVELELA